MKIITLTLSPAFDLHCRAKDFYAEHENLVFVSSREVGGKGVNISRALLANGIQNTAVVAVGEENGNDFCQALQKQGLTYQSIAVSGRIRENVTIHTDAGIETRISFSGFAADDGLTEDVMRVIGEVDSDTVVTLTGRVPSGVSMNAVKAFVCRLQQQGARIVIDSKSFDIEDLIACRPWLVKPNGEEIAAYVGHEVETLEQAFEAAKALHGAGITYAMVTLGQAGACLACADGCFYAVPPHVKVRSTIGAGDSSIAGFLAGACYGLCASELLQTAVAFGSAACLTDGTQPPQADDVRSLLKSVTVQSIF